MPAIVIVFLFFLKMSVIEPPATRYVIGGKYLLNNDTVTVVNEYKCTLIYSFEGAKYVTENSQKLSIFGNCYEKNTNICFAPYDFTHRATNTIEYDSVLVVNSPNEQAFRKTVFNNFNNFRNNNNTN